MQRSIAQLRATYRYQIFTLSSLRIPTDESAAAITDFLTDMRRIGKPINLDDKSPTLVKDANGGVRAENMKRGSAACTKLLKVSKCSGTPKPTEPKEDDDAPAPPMGACASRTVPKKYPVCVSGTEERFGLETPKYKGRPDGIVVSSDGTCTYATPLSEGVFLSRECNPQELRRDLCVTVLAFGNLYSLFKFVHTRRVVTAALAPFF
jgi:hypothetical protein